MIEEYHKMENLVFLNMFYIPASLLFIDRTLSKYVIFKSKYFCHSLEKSVIEMYS